MHIFPANGFISPNPMDRRKGRDITLFTSAKNGSYLALYAQSRKKAFLCDPQKRLVKDGKIKLRVYDFSTFIGIDVIRLAHFTTENDRQAPNMEDFKDKQFLTFPIFIGDAGAKVNENLDSKETEIVLNAVLKPAAEKLRDCSKMLQDMVQELKDSATKTAMVALGNHRATYEALDNTLTAEALNLFADYDSTDDEGND